MHYHYLELQDGDKVVKRIKTSIPSENKDRRMIQQFQKPGQEIRFVVSSEKEKLIHNL